MANILIIDDDKTLCDLLMKKLNNLNHTATCSHTISIGLQVASKADFDLIVLDVHLPDGSGLELLPKLKMLASKPEIIIITGEGDPDGAEIAIETGAWNYIEKPLSTREFKLQVSRALQYHEGKLSRKPLVLLKKNGIIGNDPKLEKCFEQIAQTTVNKAPVLITGETGTGKELFARAVHANSNRSDGPFVVLDCAAIPEKLVESLLFGHQKGAFTGADKNRDGLILEANQGTLFLDEVGELPLSIQKTFLRVLQEHRFRPVGAKHEMESDFRLVAATNCDLDEMAKVNLFRIDLLFRLKAVHIHLPPLRERKSDIEALAFHFISGLCKLDGIGVKGVSPDFFETLCAYDWPGNIRELKNTIDCSLSNAKMHEMLYPAHLPANLRVNLIRKTVAKGNKTQNQTIPSTPLNETLPSLKTSIEDTEKKYLTTLMLSTLGDIQSACRISGLSRSGLYSRLKKYSIERPS